MSEIDQAQADIETLLQVLRASGEWQDEHDDILGRWRARRGEAGKIAWRWWWKLPDDDLYCTDEDTKQAAIAAALREYPGTLLVDVIEARSWNDDITAGEDEEWFAESRNKETVAVAAND